MGSMRPSVSIIGPFLFLTPLAHDDGLDHVNGDHQS